MKLLLALSTVLILSGCSPRLDESENKAVMEIVKEACDKVGGQFVFGFELEHFRFKERLTTSYYCITPKTEEIR